MLEVLGERRGQELAMETSQRVNCPVAALHPGQHYGSGERHNHDFQMPPPTPSAHSMAVWLSSSCTGGEDVELTSTGLGLR